MIYKSVLEYTHKPSDHVKQILLLAIFRASNYVWRIVKVTLIAIHQCLTYNKICLNFCFTLYSTIFEYYMWRHIRLFSLNHIPFHIRHNTYTIQYKSMLYRELKNKLKSLTYINLSSQIILLFCTHIHSLWTIFSPTGDRSIPKLCTSGEMLSHPIFAPSFRAKYIMTSRRYQ